MAAIPMLCVILRLLPARDLRSSVWIVTAL